MLEGWDNTLTNIRIADVFIGVWLKSAGNILRNVHPLYTLDYTDYERSCGFIVEGNRPDNWFDFCYSDQFSTGFLVNARITMHNCFCFWYSPLGKQHNLIVSDMNAINDDTYKNICPALLFLNGFMLTSRL